MLRELNTASIEDLNALGNALRRNPHITTLDLQYNCLNEWSLVQITAFIEGLKGTSIATLDLGWNRLDMWNQAQIIALMQEGLLQTNITKLDLGWNHLYNWNLAQITAFSQRLRNSNITILDLEYIHLNKWSVEQVKALFEGLRDSPVTTLELLGNFPLHWSETLFSAFVEGLQVTNITNLVFSAEEEQEIISKIIPKIIHMINISTEHIKSFAACEENDEGNEGKERALGELIDNNIARLSQLSSMVSGGVSEPQLTALKNEFYTAILIVLINNVEENLDAIDECLAKITTVTDDSVAFDIACNFIFQPTRNKRLGVSLFCRFTEKVDLDNKILRVLYQGILTDNILGSSPEDVLMTPDEIREVAAQRLLSYQNKQRRRQQTIGLSTAKASSVVTSKSSTETTSVTAAGTSTAAASVVATTFGRPVSSAAGDTSGDTSCASNFRLLNTQFNNLV